MARELPFEGPWELCNDHPDANTAMQLATIRRRNRRYSDDSVASIYCFANRNQAEAARAMTALPELWAAAHAALDDVDALRAEGHEDPAWAPALRAAIAKGSAA